LEKEAQLEREEAAKTRKSLFQQRRNQQDEVTRLQKKLMMAEMVSKIIKITDLCSYYDWAWESQ